MGNNIPIKQPEFLTPNEYRELMQIFVHAALGGPIVKNLNNSFNSIPGLSGFEIIDKISSRTTTKSHLWATNEFEEPTKLDRFEFVLSTPFDVFFDSKKLKLIQDFVNKIKPTRTSMVVIPTMSKIEDRFLLNEQAKEAYKFKMYKGSPNRPIIEKITAEEHLRLDFLETRQRFGSFAVDRGDGVAHLACAPVLEQRPGLGRLVDRTTAQKSANANATRNGSKMASRVRRMCCETVMLRPVNGYRWRIVTQGRFIKTKAPPRLGGADLQSITGSSDRHQRRAEGEAAISST